MTLLLNGAGNSFSIQVSVLDPDNISKKWLGEREEGRKMGNEGGKKERKGERKKQTERKKGDVGESTS